MDIVLASTVAEAMRRREKYAELISDMKVAWADSPYGLTALSVPRPLLPEFIKVAEAALENLNKDIESL